MTLDFRPEVECAFRACAMHPAIIVVLFCHYGLGYMGQIPRSTERTVLLVVILSWR